ncbi:polysaccharide deacetylase family protein [Paraburkholderia lycopersici]|uniref:Peptidoglycan/xylan/chitin deacetylase, PgdA/CDA1 family n=1 Tax=Paraburkholderia lycopersici TaxID=416944 RepID=A0A1G6M4U6_9BURK|nr:polysaccharide deacetylase family protein [Paraburkholderia lycopersici]SDC50490.1 Peptidoglycan/xylan/chitin deacetylase, PgdA/CDA1 family [Paraburkholderia lycopersici]
MSSPSSPSMPFAPAAPASATSRRWKPSPLICTAAAVHAGAAVALAARPGAWPWAAGGVAASHLVLTAAGLWPRSTLLGPNWTRLPEHAGQRIALTIDDGPDPEVTPRVLDLLDRHDVRATFFCIGDLARRYPRWIEAIVARGHAVENHSQRHRHTFSLSGPLVMKREIETAQRTLTEIAGVAPRFFRAPAGLRNPFLEPVLCGLGLHLASWTRRGFDTCAKDSGTVTRRLTTGLAPRDILLVHDGHAARDARGEPLVLDVLPALLRAAAERQLQWTTLRACLNEEAAEIDHADLP